MDLLYRGSEITAITDIGQNYSSLFLLLRNPYAWGLAAMSTQKSIWSATSTRPGREGDRLRCLRSLFMLYQSYLSSQRGENCSHGQISPNPGEGSCFGRKANLLASNFSHSSLFRWSPEDWDNLYSRDLSQESRGWPFSDWGGRLKPGIQLVQVSQRTVDSSHTKGQPDWKLDVQVNI